MVGYNPLTAEVDQGFLLPPDMRDWLDRGHLVFTVIDAVAQFDPFGVDAGYRADGRGADAGYSSQINRDQARSAGSCPIPLVEVHPRSATPAIAPIRDRHDAVATEWQMMIAAHNLLKDWRPAIRPKRAGRLATTGNE